MFNAKKARRKADKAQRKNFNYYFNLLIFSVKDHAKRGENSCSMFLDEFCYTEDDVNLVVDYFKSKDYTVSIEGVPSSNGIRKKIIISW